MDYKIFISGIPSNTTDRQVRDYFNKYHEYIKLIEISKRESIDLLFITLGANKKIVSQFIVEYNYKVWDNKVLKVQKAKETKIHKDVIAKIEKEKDSNKITNNNTNDNTNKPVDIINTDNLFNISNEIVYSSSLFNMKPEDDDMDGELNIQRSKKFNKSKQNEDEDVNNNNNDIKAVDEEDLPVKEVDSVPVTVQAPISKKSKVIEFKDDSDDDNAFVTIKKPEVKVPDTIIEEIKPIETKESKIKNKNKRVASELNHEEIISEQQTKKNANNFSKSFGFEFNLSKSEFADSSFKLGAMLSGVPSEEPVQFVNNIVKKSFPEPKRDTRTKEPPKGFSFKNVDLSVCTFMCAEDYYQRWKTHKFNVMKDCKGQHKQAMKRQAKFSSIHTHRY